MYQCSIVLQAGYNCFRCVLLTAKTLTGGVRFYGELVERELTRLPACLLLNSRSTVKKKSDNLYPWLSVSANARIKADLPFQVRSLCQ